MNILRRAKRVSCFILLSVLFTTIVLRTSSSDRLFAKTIKFESESGHVYQLFDEGLKWKDAKAYCKKIGGHLATITSDSEQKEIEQLIEEGSRNSYWIGGYKTFSGWKWVTEEKFEYTKWATGQPDDNTNTSDNGEDSLMVYRNQNPMAGSWLGAWNDLHHNGTCGDESFFGLSNFGFICEWESGHTYQIIEEGMEWEQAKNYCECVGGHLATITTEVEQKEIEQLLQKGKRNSYWIGGHKESDGWKWITGEQFNYTQWATGQPDYNTFTSIDGEDSLMIYRNQNPNAGSWMGAWNDLFHDGTCGNESFFGLSNFGFVCEWDFSRESIFSAKISMNKAEYTFIGEKIKPYVSVKIGDTILTKNVDYRIKYKNNKKIGKATVYIIGMGEYVGVKSKSFSIVPKGTSLSKLSVKGRDISIYWSKQGTDTSGYQIQYSTSKKFNRGKIKTKSITKPKTSTTIYKLKGQSQYYVRIRTYKKVKDVKYYSSWSKVKKISTR